MVFSRALAVTIVFFTALAGAAILQGTVQVVDNQSNSKGFLMNGDNRFNGIDTVGDPLMVSVDTSAPSGQDLVAINLKSGQPGYIGARTSVYNPDLGLGSIVIAALENVTQTLPDARPNENFVESAIWYFQRSTTKLIPQWVNTDGSLPTTHIAYSAGSNWIFFTGDVATYNLTHVDNVTEVGFYLKYT